MSRINRHLYLGLLYVKRSLGETGQPHYHSIVSEWINEERDVEASFVSRTIAVINRLHRLLDGFNFVVTFCIGTVHKNLALMVSVKF
jgi:hypothetical protein